ncbi:MAG: S9 family peptidase [Alteromonadaceae bacterium]|nr:S9 family peptidase [Alteromonadaceae bacterium]
MKTPYKTLLLLVSLLCGLSFTAHSAPKQALSYQQFAHLPMVQYARVSPDGKHIVAVLNSVNGPSVVVSKFADTKLSSIAQLTKNRDRIDNLYWVNNNRVLISASQSRKSGKNRYRVSSYFAVNIDGSEVMPIKARKNKSATTWEQRWVNYLSLISTLPHDDEHVLVQVYDFKDKANAVFKVNIYTNKFTKLFSNTYDVYRWFANSDDIIQFGIGSKKNAPEVTQIWFKNSEADEWKMISERKVFEGDTFTPVLVKDNKLWVISDRINHRDALWEYDPVKGEYTKEIYSNDKYDIDGVVYAQDRKTPIGVRYTAHYDEIHYFNSQEQSLSKTVKASFKNYHTSIANMSLDSKKVLILAENDNSPTKYFWLDLNKKSGGFWFSRYPSLEGKMLAKKQPFTFKARDGMEIYGYLTMPVGLKSGIKPPFIVHPHGGPIGVRDDQGFDYVTQFLAAQGYAVLQTNFRGSGGYGKNYLTAGYKGWGKKMQQDVYDSIDWLEKLNIVDNNKTCFVGWSYGGYAALTAAFQKPNDFNCIISIAGISDLEGMASHESSYRGSLKEQVLKEIGDPDDDIVNKELKSLSAINQLEKIKSPILLIHGRNDTQVHYGQSKNFYKAAKKANLNVKYIEFKYGTHYLDEEQNRLDAFKEIELFLHEYLK